MSSPGGLPSPADLRRSASFSAVAAVSLSVPLLSALLDGADEADAAAYDSSSNAEFDVDARIAEHLNEIQRLRAGNTVRAMQQQQQHSKHAAAAAEHAVVDQVRVGRTIRSFHHARTSSTVSAASLEEMADHARASGGESVPRTPDELRRSINGDEAHSDHEVDGSELRQRRGAKPALQYPRAALSLHIAPGETASDQRSDEDDDTDLDSDREGDAVETTLSPRAAARFKHDRTPASMSERLALVAAMTPARGAGHSHRPSLSGLPLSPSAARRGSALAILPSRREQEQHFSTRKSSIAGDELTLPMHSPTHERLHSADPERVTSSIFASMRAGSMDGSAADSDDDSQHNLAEVIAAASSTVNIVQPCARGSPSHSPQLLSLPRSPAVPSIALDSADSPQPPGLKRSSTLPALDGDTLVVDAGSQWKASASHTPSMLKRSLTVSSAAPGRRSSAVTIMSPLLSPSSSSPLLASPTSSGLTSAAWLERRMKKMFHPEVAGDSLAPGAHDDPLGVGEREELSSFFLRVALAWLPPAVQVLLPVLILFQALVIPLRLAFGSSRDGGAVGSSFDSLQRWDLPLDAAFLFGVVLTDFVQIDVHSRGASLRPALRRAGKRRTGMVVQLALDVLSTLPYEFLGLIWPLAALWTDPRMATPIRLTALVRLPRLLRLTRLFQSMDSFETRNLVDTFVNPTLFRLAKLAVMMYLVAHLAGCGYVFLSYIEGCPEGNEWIVPSHIRSQSLGSQYLHSLYWGFCAMTGNGSGVETPQTFLEHCFALCVLLIGVSTYATLIGSLSSIIQKMNSKQEAFRDKMTDIGHLMDTYQLPEDVQHRVKSCFQYLFGVSTLSAADESDDTPRSRGEGWETLAFLPAYLRNELLCHINGEIIHKVPLFRGCSDGFMRSLVPLLRPEVVIPGDFIIRTGEIGREMYLVRHGQLEVIAHGVVVATLSDGSYVGEVAVMFEQKRTASVRAITFCDILVLSKDDFDGVLSQYPEVQRSMKMQATMRRNARSMQDKELATETEKANSASARKLHGIDASKASSKSIRKSPRKQSVSAAQKTLITVTPAAVDSSAPPTAASSAASKKGAQRASVKQIVAEGNGHGNGSSSHDASTVSAPIATAAAAVSPSSALLSPASASGVDATSGLSSPSDGGSGNEGPAHSRTQSKWKKLRLLTRGQ